MDFDELYDLEIPAVLPDETVPERAPNIAWYFPDGRPMPERWLGHEGAKGYEELKRSHHLVADLQLNGVYVQVSTIWIGINMQFREVGPPITFESMIFTSMKGLDGFQWRYATWPAAIAGHGKIVMALADLGAVPADPSDVPPRLPSS